MFPRVLVTTTALAVFAFAGTAWAQANPSGNSLIPLAGPSNASPGDSVPTMGTSSISGNITTQDNSPVKDAKVEIRDMASGMTVGFGYTQTGGGFQLSN